MFCKYFFITFLIQTSSSFDLVVTKVQNCDDKIYPLGVHFEIEDKNFLRRGSINLTLPVQDYPVTADITFSLNGKHYSKLGTLRDRACTALNKYVGEVWYELERAAHILPRVCPIKKGNYTIHNLHVSVDRFALQALPKAWIKAILLVYQMNSKKVLACVLVEALNK